MRKSLVAAFLILSLNIAIKPANAINIDITTASIGIETYAMGGTLTDTGDFGIASSIDCAFFCNFNFDGIEYFSDTSGNTLNYSGTTVLGSYDYNFTLSEGQAAWGANWNWNDASAVLIILDCAAGNAGDACTGSTLPMQSLPFPSESWSFTGVVSPVPIPAAIWLFGAGLLCLIGVAKRN